MLVAQGLSCAMGIYTGLEDDGVVTEEKGNVVCYVGTAVDNAGIAMRAASPGQVRMCGQACFRI